MEKEKTQISLTLAENESVIRTWCVKIAMIFRSAR